MHLMVALATLFAASIALSVSGCGKQSAAPPTNPDTMEGGSGAKPPPPPDDAMPPVPPGDDVSDLPYNDPLRVRKFEAMDQRADIKADELPISRGGLVSDHEWYGGGDDGSDPAPIEHRDDGRAVRVWYATNRAMEMRPTPDDTDPPSELRPFYGNTRDENNQVHLGSVICFVPNSRPYGTLGSSWVTRMIKGEDDRIRIERVLLETNPDWFYESLRLRLARAPENDRSILVYVHGFKNSFDSAAMRAAQLAVDLNVPGLTAFYSWPSLDTVSEYSADEAAVETAEKHLTEFLTRLSTDTGATRVHLIAHSMGNRLVARTMQRVMLNAGAGNQVKFGQIILAAPDMDLDTFRDLAQAYPKLSERTTLYISQKDMALEASAWKHSFARVGYAPPIAIIPGMDTVEVTSIDVSVLGHGYVAEARGVMTDIAMLLRKDTSPTEKRRKLEPTTTGEGGQYWILREDK